MLQTSQTIFFTRGSIDNLQAVAGLKSSRTMILLESIQYYYRALLRGRSFQSFLSFQNKFALSTEAKVYVSAAPRRDQILLDSSASLQNSHTASYFLSSTSLFIYRFSITDHCRCPILGSLPCWLLASSTPLYGLFDLLNHQHEESSQPHACIPSGTHMKVSSIL